MVINTISEGTHLRCQANPAGDAQDPNIQQGNRQQQTREMVRVLKLRQFQVETPRFDVRKQFFTAKAAGLVAQGALRRTTIGGNEPGIITGIITGQRQMDRAITLRQGQLHIG